LQKLIQTKKQDEGIEFFESSNELIARAIDKKINQEDDLDFFSDDKKPELKKVSILKNKQFRGLKSHVTLKQVR